LGLILAALVTATLATSAPAASAADPDLTEVASSCNGGSSNPTFYAGNRRTAVTAGGRVLVVYDPHGSGQQLKWRDAGSSTWRDDTRGVPNGQLLAPGDIANDRTASIVVGRDSLGAERAWVVYAGYDYKKVSAVKMRRLSDLDSPLGPSVGPEVNLEPEGRGNVRVDMAFEDTSSGPRAVLSWVRRTGDTQYQLVVAGLSSLDSDTPSLVQTTALYTGSVANTAGTLVPSAQGMRVVARTSKLKLFAHSPSAALTSWTSGSASVSIARKAKPTAVALSSGDIIAVGESDTSAHVVKAIRFSSSGNTAATELTTSSGYANPAVVHTSGDNALLVMVNRTTNSVVSRARTGSSWGTDVTEIGPAAGGDYAWPNVMREPVGGYLRVLVDGARCPTSKQRNQVLAYSRLLADLGDGTGVGTITNDDRAASKLSLRARKRPSRIRVNGLLTPAHGGTKVKVVLKKRRSGAWVSVRTKRPLLGSGIDRDADGIRESGYRTKFRRPARTKRCRVVVWFKGDVDHLPSRARRTFYC